MLIKRTLLIHSPNCLQKAGSGPEAGSRKAGSQPLAGGRVPVTAGLHADGSWSQEPETRVRLAHGGQVVSSLLCWSVLG